MQSSLLFDKTHKVIQTSPLCNSRTPHHPQKRTSMPTNSHSSFSAPTTRQPLTTFCHSVQSSSVAQSRPTLCKPLDCSTPGLPVPHQLPELTQTHVHRVSDAIQPSHPVIPFSSSLQSFLAPGSFPVSWLSTSGGQSIGVSASASVFPMNIQD